MRENSWVLVRNCVAAEKTGYAKWHYHLTHFEWISDICWKNTCFESCILICHYHVCYVKHTYTHTHTHTHRKGLLRLIQLKESWSFSAISCVCYLGSRRVHCLATTCTLSSPIRPHLVGSSEGWPLVRPLVVWY